MKLKNLVVELKGAQKGAFACNTWMVQRGEQWVITGPNGSGKSYLAALLSGNLPLCGVQLAFGDGIEDHVSVVTFTQQQEQAATSWLQARWHGQNEDAINVRKFLSYEEVNEINPFEVRADETAERDAFAKRLRKFGGVFNVQPLWNRLLVQLSNGEMRRVLLTRALLKEPRLLILDDPFAGLDREMRIRLQDALNRLSDEGLPMLLMVRNEDEIPACATHRLFLDHVQIVGKRKRGQRRLHSKAQIPGKNDRRAFLGRVDPDPRSHRVSSLNPVIELRSISVRYGRRILFDKFDWTVNAGTRWIITGPNGSGKTTLLSLISGDNPAAYANDVRVFGHARGPGESLWPIRRRIGQVSPEIQCHFDTDMFCLDAVLSGRYNNEGQKMRPTRTSREEAREWLLKLGLAGVERIPLGALSAGRQRLVLLARAMFPKPDLLLLDEPCLNLDTDSKRLVLDVLEKLLNTHPEETVVCVTHRSDDIPRGFNRILRLPTAPSM